MNLKLDIIIIFILYPFNIRHTNAINKIIKDSYENYQNKLKTVTK